MWRNQKGIQTWTLTCERLSAIHLRAATHRTASQDGNVVAPCGQYSFLGDSGTIINFVLASSHFLWLWGILYAFLSFFICCTVFININCGYHCSSFYCNGEYSSFIDKKYLWDFFFAWLVYLRPKEEKTPKRAPSGIEMRWKKIYNFWKELQQGFYKVFNEISIGERFLWLKFQLELSNHTSKKKIHK